MLHSERHSEGSRKWTYYLQRLYTERSYGVLQSVSSVAAIAGSFWIAFNPEAEVVKELINSAAPVYLLGTAAAVCLGTIGMIDGIRKVHNAVGEIAKEERKIISANYRVRGFFLNRTVEAA